MNNAWSKKTNNHEHTQTTSYPQPYLPGSDWAAGTAMDNSNMGEENLLLVNT